MAARLTPLSKFLITAVVLGGVGTLVYRNKDKLLALAPEAEKPKSNVPPIATLPDDPGPAVTPGTAGCADKPEVPLLSLGVERADGDDPRQRRQAGDRRQPDVQARREPEADPRGQHRQMQDALVTFAEGLKKGETQPDGGRALRRHHGRRLGDVPEGRSTTPAASSAPTTRRWWSARRLQPRRGQVHGPARVEDEPADGARRPGRRRAARRRLEHRAQVAGRQQDPATTPTRRPTTPTRSTGSTPSDYIDAAQKYVSGFCSRPARTSRPATRRSTASTASSPGRRATSPWPRRRAAWSRSSRPSEYRSQMPNVIIGIKKWMTRQPRASSKGMLHGDLRGRRPDQARRRGASARGRAVSALVYKEKDAAYWYKYFQRRRRRTDKQGLSVELGGSSVNNLADNLQLFGLAPGSANAVRRDLHGVRRHREVAVPGPRAQLLPGGRDPRHVVRQGAGATRGRRRRREADLPKFAGERR